ncbi:MAG: stage III sporulation protein AB [Clostridiales bacterium]|nr:stage III sporulation protein AB [Clostridiales bacterium]
MKLLGSFLLLAAGYLFSLCLMEPVWQHIQLIEEGEFLFRLMESEIRNGKTPLPQLFSEISQRTVSQWKNFFSDLSEGLRENGDFELSDEFDRLLLFYFSPLFSEEEHVMFYQMGRNLLSDDLLFLRNSSEQFSSNIREHLTGMKEQAKTRQKVLHALCLSASALLIILLL